LKCSAWRKRFPFIPMIKEPCLVKNSEWNIIGKIVLFVCLLASPASRVTRHRAEPAYPVVSRFSFFPLESRCFVPLGSLARKNRHRNHNSKSVKIFPKELAIRSEGTARIGHICIE
jgi:hypothetical protein